jgi:hypothetical protein
MTEPYPPQPGEPPRPPGAPEPPYGQPPPAAPYGQPVPPTGFGPGEQYPGQQYPGQQYPGQQYPGQQYPGQPVPPPKKSRVGRIIAIIAGVLALLLIVCVVAVFFIVRNNAPNAADAKEGDCLSGNAITSTTRQETQGLKITGCGKSDARYKVVGRVPDKSRAQADQSLCQPFVDQGAEIFYWQEKSPGAGTGTVLCLKNNK